MMAIVHNGDAMNPEDIEKAFVAIDGVDAVVSTLGGTTADPTVDSQASGGPGSLGAWEPSPVCRRTQSALLQRVVSQPASWPRCRVQQPAVGASEGGVDCLLTVSCPLPPLPLFPACLPAGQHQPD